jgi:serine/threonine-protein kinase
VKLTPDGQLRLVDFGLATSRSESDPHAATVTLARGGSPPYQPLEQASGGRVDARSDLYALGATLFHLLAGHPPPPAAERFVAPDNRAVIRAYRDDVPDGLARAIDTALALHPDQRPATTEAMLALIHGTSSASAAQSVWPAALRANWWLVAFVLVLLFAAGALSVTP